MTSLSPHYFYLRERVDLFIYTLKNTENTHGAKRFVQKGCEMAQDPTDKLIRFYLILICNNGETTIKHSSPFKGHALDLVCCNYDSQGGEKISIKALCINTVIKRIFLERKNKAPLQLN